MTDTREELVARAFVDLADTLADHYDVGDLLFQLVECCKQILDIDVGGVMIEGPDGNLQRAAMTSEMIEQLEQMEIEHQEGPCFDAYHHGERVVVTNLRREQSRWPNVAPRAAELGLLAVYAFPLQVRGDCIGALDLYRHAAGDFREEDMRLAQAFASVAAIGILQERKVSEAEHRAEQLQHALESRVVVEQAKGVLAERYRISTQEAFDAIRRYARHHRRKLSEVCREIISGVDLVDPGPGG